MSKRPCPVCEAAMPPGAEIDTSCTGATLGRLYDAPGLLRELAVTVTRQSSRGDGGAGGDAVDYDEAAARAADRLELILRHYVGEWGRTTRIRGDQAPEVARLMSSAGGRAALIASPGLAARPWAPPLVTDLRAATEEAWRRIDSPPQTTFVGWCECGRALYARTDGGTATCPGCWRVLEVSARRVEMMARLPGIRERIMTKPQLAVLCRIPVGTLHRWSSERRIATVGVNVRGQPEYLAGPVIDAVLAGIPPQKLTERNAS